MRKHNKSLCNVLGVCMGKTLKKLLSFQALLIVFFVVCLCCVFPASRNLIIMLMEKIIGRGLKDMTKWNAVIIGSMSFFAMLALFTYFLLYVQKGKIVLSVFFQKIKEVFCSKKAIVHLTILFGIYCLCYLTLFRANYDFQDDIKRIISGHKSWVGASRYISESLSVFLHTNFYLNDIAPLTQILAAAFLAITSYIIAYSITEGKITKLSLLASTLIGLCPFYFENMSYKFDSPYMAMAMLFGVLPFLFTKDVFTYCAISVMSLMLVLTSYQAGNSIYIMLTLFLILKMLLSSDKKQALRFLMSSIFCYLAVLIIFRLLIMIPTESTIDERNTSIQFGISFFQLLKRNFIDYIVTVFSRYGNIWIRLFTVFAVILFPIAIAKHTERYINSALLAVFTLIIMFALSFGAYLVIGNTLLSDRAFMGFDALIAIISVTASGLYTPTAKKSTKLITATTIICLFYGCAIYSIVKGNLYTKQNDYQKFRYTIMLGDLSHVINPNAHNEAYIVGDIGPSTSSIMEYKNYGLNIGGYSSGWTHILIQDWNMDLDFMATDSYEDVFNKKATLKAELEAMPLLVSSYYHDIYGENDRYLVRLKNPQVSEYEIK